jgi:hypothetical protein
MEPKKGTKNPPKNGPKTSSTILQFTTIFINFFNFDHFHNFMLFLNFPVHFNFDHFLKLQDDFIGEQGLAALALVNFADEYEIEGDRQLEVGISGGRIWRWMWLLW